MAICREFYFPSSDGSSRIHAAEWTPESGEIIGVLQIAHGVAEYGMRYAPFAEFMTEHTRMRFIHSRIAILPHTDIRTAYGRRVYLQQNLIFINRRHRNIIQPDIIRSI